MGVYATEVPEEISALDALASNPRNGVSSITEADYNAALKKNPNQTPAQVTSRPVSTPVLQSPVPQAVEGNRPVVVTEAKPPAPETEQEGAEESSEVAAEADGNAPLPDPADAVQTGDVEPMTKPTPVERKRARKSAGDSDSAKTE